VEGIINCIWEVEALTWMEKGVKKADERPREMAKSLWRKGSVFYQAPSSFEKWGGGEGRMWERVPCCIAFICRVKVLV